ncbi:4-carboxymuconolactone decarboxylase [Jatrophihabitans sp. GAS493]|uniref:carboxymuconolactone decarboxylase family protein n=1 Tax=Jatrophihabitans sp. GAS493 TaxID=1907575 RepID=UPI000BB6DD5F|nr:carboxymuconolactone decarboxylase family protein [Jatrophihabitans sp. GAS493]SOD71794.1 4-carboxymuconolactone decarboxylase [Jatrophihabitans sp. GAS493]
MADSQTDQAGPQRRRRAQGAKADRLQEALVSLDPTVARWADEFVFGEVWAGEALAHRDRMLVAIAMLSATTRRNQLRNYLHGALQDGIAEAELREIMKMLVVYSGFPAALEGMQELDAVLAVHGRHA